jgi:hypothetical protein
MGFILNETEEKWSTTLPILEARQEVKTLIGTIIKSRSVLLQKLKTKSMRNICRKDKVIQSCHNSLA